MTISRRSVLVASLATAAAAAIGSFPWWRSDAVDLLSQRMAALFPEIVAAAPTVHQSASLAVGSGDSRLLTQALFGSSTASLARAQPQAILEVLARAVDGDFEAGRLVVIDGWTLSRTEARLVALIALAPG